LAIAEPFFVVYKNENYIFLIMVKKEEIGTQHYSKILDRNIEIKEGPEDEWYRLIGLECVLEPEVKSSSKTKMTFPKIEDNDSNK
jgi:hypothetical protein